MEAVVPLKYQSHRLGVIDRRLQLGQVLVIVNADDQSVIATKVDARDSVILITAALGAG